MKTITYVGSDGQLHVVHPCPGAQGAEESEDEFLSRVAARAVPADATSVQVLESSALPSDRSFRDAWALRGGGVSVDMPKAREIHKAKLRGLRAPLLAVLDVEYQRADEAGDGAAKARIVAEKNRLRDVTKLPAISAAATPEELKSIGI